MCKISIIIPIYNSEKYLTHCLDSILKQTYQDFEVILVNDGSTDNSAKICDNYTITDARFKVIHKQNQGVSIARNTGISYAKGEYISFIDSDDWIENDYLKNMINIATSSADLIVSGVIYDYSIENHKTKTVKDNIFNICDSNFFHELVKSRLLFGPVAKLYKTDIIKSKKIKFPEDISYGEDRLFNYEYLKYVTKIATINSCNYHYIMHNSGSLSSKKYSNMFALEYDQWVKLHDLYEFHENLTIENKTDLYEELFWIINDNIFTQNQNIKYKHIKEILSVPHLTECKRFKDSINYNKFVKWCIFNRNHILLYLLLSITKLCKK